VTPVIHFSKFREPEPVAAQGFRRPKANKKMRPFLN